MKRLQLPLRRHLDEPITEVTVQRMWRGVLERRGTVRNRPRALWTGLALAGAALTFVFTWFVWTAGPSASSGPLTLADGREIGVLEAPVTVQEPLDRWLSDGSRIRLAAGARLSQLESTNSSFAVLLSAGRVDFDVKKGGPRRWSIECGLATVEVVGTRFTVDRAPARVVVEVNEGVVLVRGERVPDRVRKLTAGEVIEISAALAETDTPPPAENLATPSPLATPAVSASAAALQAPLAAQGAWKDLARRGQYKEAYQALGAQGIAREVTGSSADDLLSLADVARLSGHPTDAVAPLRRVIGEHPGDARAGLAAFTLGRVELDGLGQPAGAAQSFATAIRLGLGGGLQEDARARLVEARARAGDIAGARAAAEEYDRLFPGGHHRAAVRRWAGDP